MSVELPLSGKRIVLTRAEGQLESSNAELTKLGAKVIPVPMIRIERAALSAEDSSRIAALERYDAVIFTSANAVENALGNAEIKRATGARPFVVVIGSKTAEVAARHGLVADFIPEKYSSGELLKSLQPVEWKAKKVLLPKGNLSGSELADSIRSMGGVVDEIIVYNTLPNDEIDRTSKETVTSGLFDIVIFFSPSQVRNFLHVFGARVLDGKEVAVIGPTTKSAAEKNGLTVDVVPAIATTESLISSLVHHEET